jgi:hypothetical protein
MFETPIESIRMRSRSPQARDFWKNRYKPTMDAIKERIVATPLSVGIWAPKLIGATRLQVHEIQNDLQNLNIEVFVWTGEDDGESDSIERAMFQLASMCGGEKAGEDAGEKGGASSGKAPDIVFGIVLETGFDLTRFLTIGSETASRLFLFVNAAIEDRYRQDDPEFEFRSIYRRAMIIRYPEDFQDRTFHRICLSAVDVLRRAKYIQSLFPESNKPLKSKRNVFTFYEDYKRRIDTFQSSGHNYFISFVRFLPDPTSKTLLKHLETTPEQIDRMCRYFEDLGFIEVDPTGRLKLTYSGDKYFKLIGTDSLPILENEKRRFIERWRSALQKTYYTDFELLSRTNELKALSDDLYFSLARSIAPFRKLRYFVNRTVFDWMTEEEEKFWNHPWIQQLFKIWRENIAGVKRIWRPAQRDRTAFLEYMFRKFAITHHPKHKDLFDNYKSLAFNLTFLRPNSHAHFYVIFSFIVRPIKKIIRQYFDIAAITGQYDLIFRRFPPYHYMLKLHSKPGERTSFDQRQGLDWRPLTFKMETRFTVPVELDPIRTRQRDRTIAIPVVKDPEAEKEKKAEITALEQKIGHIPKDLLHNYDFRDDGKIYYTGKEEPEPIDVFMSKRGPLIQTEDELKLVRAMPRPGAQSGLIVRFNLLDPIAVLINGINRQRDLYLDELRYLARCLDLLAKSSVAELDAIIDEVFESPQETGFSEETLDLLNNLERIEKVEGSEEQAWGYLTSRFIHGAHHPILEAICHRLMNDGFEVLFSLMPLLTGKELRFDDEGRIEETQVASTENQLPIVENLKRELSDLLKNVFTRHLDISGATQRRQSEARLSQMIVSHCLNVNSDPDAFRNRIQSHLQEHYDAHLHFLKEHIGDSELFKYIHKIGSDVGAMIETDVEEIIRLTGISRNRLYSRMNNNRLLCFIDPASVEVQLGEFDYGGEAIESEMAYITSKETKQRELAEKQHAYDAQIREREMEKTTAIEKGRHEREQEEARLTKEKAMRQAQFDHDRERVQAEKAKEDAITAMLEEINGLKLRQIASETRYLAAEALKQQDMRTYALLSLLDAHQNAGGIEGVEDLLEDSPNLLFAIAPEAVETRHVHKLKEEVVDKLDTVLQNVDPITLSTLFSKDYSELIRSDIYNSIMKELAETLKNFGFRHRPMMEQVFSGTGVQQGLD